MGREAGSRVETEGPIFSHNRRLEPVLGERRLGSCVPMCWTLHAVPFIQDTSAGTGLLLLLFPDREEARARRGGLSGLGVRGSLECNRGLVDL